MATAKICLILIFSKTEKTSSAISGAEMDPLRKHVMSMIRTTFILAIALLFLAPFVPVEAYSDNTRYELERSRDALLNKRDTLNREYQNLLRAEDDLNRQLMYVGQRIKIVNDDLKRTDYTLSDVEYSLRHAP